MYFVSVHVEAKYAGKGQVGVQKKSKFCMQYGQNARRNENTFARNVGHFESNQFSLANH